MTGRYRLQKTAKRLNFQKEDVRTRVPANLGLAIGGSKLVEVPTRESYHYARIRGNLSEVVQVFNISTSPVYDLPVLISYRNNRWEVEGLDTGRYTSWSNTAFLPKHGAQHSFDPDAPGGDPVWVWGRQMMPLGAVPSGSNGGPNVIIEPSTYWQDNTWHYAGGTGTQDIIPSYKPTGSSARMVLVYLDGAGNPQLLGGDTYFSANLTGTSQVVPYIPAMPDTDAIGIAGIRLVSGTSAITWNNIYDLRPWIVGNGYIPTGTFGVTDHGALTGLLDNDHPQYMLTGSVASTTLTRNEIAFGSPTNVITSSPYFHITGAAGYASTYKSVYINFLDSTGSYSNYYSLNLGNADGNLYNLALWGFGSNPTLSTLYGGGTEASPETPLKDDTLASFSFSAYAPDAFSTYYNSAVFNLIADENFDASHLGSHWQFINVMTGGYGNQNSLLLYSKMARFGGSVRIATGSSLDPYPSYYLGSEIIDGSWRTTRSGDDLVFQQRISGNWVTKGYPNTGSAAGSQGEPGTPGDNTLLLYDDNTFKVTGTAIHFNDGLNVIVTGSVAWVDWTGSVGGVTDHGALTGLLDNDHPQYRLTGTAISHLELSDLNSETYTHLTATNHTDLTDGGATTLHKHDHGGLDGLTDNDHPQYLLTGTQIDHGGLLGLLDNDHPQYLLTGTAITDEKVKISANDTDAGYLNGKLIEGAGISLTEVNDGGNETLRISYTGTAVGGLAESSISDYSGSSTIVGWSSFTNKKIYYWTIGNTVFVSYYLGGTSNSTAITFTLPYTSANNTDGNIDSWAAAANNGVTLAPPAVAILPPNSNTVTVYKDGTAAGWTNANAKYVIGHFFYKKA